MIETTASVVSGNSGGALIDGQGRAVAVTVSSRTGGSSSFSVPLSVLDRLQGSTAVTPAEYSRTHKPDSSRCYDNLYPVPDFGSVSGASLFATSRDRGTTCFYYALSELPDLDRQLLRATMRRSAKTRSISSMKARSPRRQAISCRSSCTRPHGRASTSSACAFRACRRAKLSRNHGFRRQAVF